SVCPLLTTAVTTTQTTTRHQQHSVDSGRGADRGAERTVACPLGSNRPRPRSSSPPCRHQVTAVLTATSSTVLHSDTTRRTPHARVAQSNPGLAASVNRRISALLPATMITFSESSAESVL